MKKHTPIKTECSMGEALQLFHDRPHFKQPTIILHNPQRWRKKMHFPSVYLLASLSTLHVNVKAVSVAAAAIAVTTATAHFNFVLFSKLVFPHKHTHAHTHTENNTRHKQANTGRPTEQPTDSHTYFSLILNSHVMRSHKQH